MPVARPPILVLHPPARVAPEAEQYARALAACSAGQLDVTCQAIGGQGRGTEPDRNFRALEQWRSLVELGGSGRARSCPRETPVVVSHPGGAPGGGYAATILVDWRHTGLLAETVDHPLVAPLLCPACRPLPVAAVNVLARAGAILCATDTERERVGSAVPDRPAVTLGWSAPPPSQPDAAAFQRRHGLYGPVIVCTDPVGAGQPELDLLLGFWSSLRDRPQVDHKTLVLLAEDPLGPLRPDVIVIDARDRAECDRAIAAAAATVTVAHHDAVGAAVCRSWQLGTPVLVPAGNLALAEQIVTLGGGIVYDGVETFIRGVSELVANKASYVEPGTAWLADHRRPAALGELLAGLVATVIGGVDVASR